MPESTNPSPATLARGYSVALLSAALLSTTAIFIRYLTERYRIPALVLAFWRDAFVVLTVAPALRVLRPGLLRLPRGHRPYFAAYGFVLALFNVTWTLSVALNGAAIATVLVYSSAAFTALLGWLVLKERLDWGKLVAVALCLGGCTLVSGALEAGGWQANVGGALIGVLSGLCYAAYSLMGRAGSQRGIDPWTSLLHTFGFATLYLLLFNALPDALLPGTAQRPADFFWLGRALDGWGVLFLLAAGPTVMGFGLYNVSLSLLPSSVAHLIVTAEPAFTTALAYTLLGERLNGAQIGGSLLILSGVVFLRLYNKKRIERLEPAQSV